MEYDLGDDFPFVLETTKIFACFYERKIIPTKIFCLISTIIIEGGDSVRTYIAV